jgi:segregation and condensation protein B
MPTDSQPLTTLALGATATVAEIKVPEKARLLEMGLLVGTSIELVRFAPLGDPVEIKRLSEALEIPESAVQTQLDILTDEYASMDRGITIIRLNDSYQMVSVKQFAPQVRKAMDLRRNIPLSQAAMEVLAVIAYNQPVTKSFVEQVRGVDCSGVIGSLTTKDLIEEKGRLELPGRPLLYGTTEHFLRCFNVSSLEELPPLPETEEPSAEEAPAETEETQEETAES